MQTFIPCASTVFSVSYLLTLLTLPDSYYNYPHYADRGDKDTKRLTFPEFYSWWLAELGFEPRHSDPRDHSLKDGVCHPVGLFKDWVRKWLRSVWHRCVVGPSWWSAPSLLPTLSFINCAHPFRPNFSLLLFLEPPTPAGLMFPLAPPYTLHILIVAHAIFYLVPQPSRTFISIIFWVFISCWTQWWDRM